MLCQPLPLLSSSGSFIAVVRVRCLLPLDAEQLALTEQLFDAALGELSVASRRQALLDGWGFQHGAHQNPLAWQKGFRLGSGLTLRRLGL